MILLIMNNITVIHHCIIIYEIFIYANTEIVMILKIMFLKFSTKIKKCLAMSTYYFFFMTMYFKLLFYKYDKYNIVN